MGGIIIIGVFVLFMAYVFHKVYNFRLDKLDNQEWVIWYNTSQMDHYGEPLRDYWPKPKENDF